MKGGWPAAGAARRRNLERILLVAALVAGAFWVSLAGSEKSVFTEDERDYAQAAIHLARHGVFSHAAVSEAPPPDAYREPGTAAVLAAAWRVTGVEVPRQPEDLLSGDLRFRAALYVAHVVARLAVLVAALGAAVAVRRLAANPLAPVAAFALSLSSPALQRAGDQLASEPLAAAFATLLALALAGLGEHPSGERAVGAGLLTGALALMRASFFFVSLALALAIPLLLTAESRKRRAGIAGAFLLTALLPSALWMLRNFELLGHVALADRGGTVLYARAEVAKDLASEGVRPALLAWTPSGFTAAILAKRYPASRFGSWRWGEGGVKGNFFVRALTRRKALVAELGDPLAADRALRDEALARIAAAPWPYLRAAVPIAWRSLFVERSPAWTRPFDLGLPLGLLLACSFLFVLARSLRARDRSVLAMLLPALGSFLFAVLATEGLPRFQLPSLPILWACAAALGDRFLARRGDR